MLVARGLSRTRVVLSPCVTYIWIWDTRSALPPLCSTPITLLKVSVPEVKVVSDAKPGDIQRPCKTSKVPLLLDSSTADVAATPAFDVSNRRFRVALGSSQAPLTLGFMAGAEFVM